MQIMLVEDNPLMEQVICRFLTSQGCTVIVANNAKGAVELASQHRCDLLLIDLLLPDQEGTDLLRTLRCQPGYATCPAIAMSGMGEEKRSWSREAGFSDYITKPIDLDDLLSTVRRHVGGNFEHVLGA